MDAIALLIGLLLGVPVGASATLTLIGILDRRQVLATLTARPSLTAGPAPIAPVSRSEPLAPPPGSIEPSLLPIDPGQEPEQEPAREPSLREPSLSDVQQYLWQWHDRHAQSLDDLSDRLSQLEQRLHRADDNGLTGLAPPELGPTAIAPEAPPQDSFSDWLRQVSTCGQDYQDLSTLLETGQWRAANDLTRSHLLGILKQIEPGQPTLSTWEQLPTGDLQAIAHLWHVWSNGQFGWQAQQHIWQEAGGDFGTFADRVGWRKQQAWLYADELTSGPYAPIGHLPTIVWDKRACYGLGAIPVADLLAMILDKLSLGFEQNQPENIGQTSVMSSSHEQRS